MLALISLLALASCQESSGNLAPLPAPSPVLTVTMHEYSFQVSGRLPTGRAVFRLVNAGKERHAPMLVALDTTSPPVSEQVREANPGPTLASVNPREPGDTGAFAADLERGKRYALICQVSAPDGVPHAKKGMTWESRPEAHAAPRVR